MIKLTFIAGGGIRKVHIDKRKISLLSAELNHQPLIIDLDNINQEKLANIKLSNNEREVINDLALLNSEEEMAKDIIKDFQKTGWRLTRRE